MAPADRLVTYSMNISLDGYIVGPDGGFDWSEPDEEVFAAHTDELRGIGVHLLGRRLRETMSYWETADQEPESDYSTVEWARMWRAVPKVVFSRTLTEVTGTNTRLATRGLAEEIAALRAESDEGEIALGGAELAAAAAAADLVDEYRPFVLPVVVGGGRPYWPEGLDRIDLDHVSSRTFGNGVVASRYRVVRPGA